jgi:uncharacterized glyoxalase superfamily protein PhnB
MLLLVLAATACGGSESQVEEPTMQPGMGQAGEVNPIPEGMHSANPHLVAGDMGSTLEFYEKAFGAKRNLELNSPDGAPVHAEMMIGDTIVMVSAEMPDMGTKSPRTLGGTSATLYYYVQDVDAVTKAAEAAGGKIIQPATDHFWGDRISTIEDPSGHRWMVATHVEDVSREQINERQAKMVEAMAAKQPMPTFERKTPASHFRGDMAKVDVTLSLVTKSGSEAIEFYKNALGAEEIYKAAMPDGRIMHAVMGYGDSYFYVSDAFPDTPGGEYYKPAAELGGSTANLMLYSANVDDAYSKATAAGATAKEPINNAFWGDRYGKIVDPSGIEWGLGTQVEIVPDSELPKRMEEWMKQMHGGEQGAEQPTPATEEVKAGPEENALPTSESKAEPSVEKK